MSDTERIPSGAVTVWLDVESSPWHVMLNIAGFDNGSGYKSSFLLSRDKKDGYGDPRVFWENVSNLARGTSSDVSYVSGRLAGVPSEFTSVSVKVKSEDHSDGSRSFSVEATETMDPYNRIVHSTDTYIKVGGTELAELAEHLIADAGYWSD